MSLKPIELGWVTWWHKVLEVIIELLRAQCETANQQSITAKEPIIQFLKEGECPLRKRKNPNMKLRNGASDWKVSADQDISTISSSHYSNRKAAEHCSMVQFKEECPHHRIDRPLGRSTRTEEKPLRDTTCRLCGKGLDMPCDSYWGWLSWFSRTLSHFKNRNHWPQFESCLKLSSDRSAICVKLDLDKSEKFSAWRKYTRNHHSCVIT